MAIAGLVLAILIWPVGLVLSIVALNQIKTSGQGGRGLAVAGIIISALQGLLVVLLLATGSFGG
jgi:hypothetical protein